MGIVSVSSICALGRLPANILITCSLADPETFMAKAGRQRVKKSQSTETASEIASSDKTEHALPSVQRALSASSQDRTILNSYDTGSDMAQILPASANQEETMQARPSVTNSLSDSKTQTVGSETCLRDPQSEELIRTTHLLAANDPAGVENQRAIEQDREKLQRLREIVVQMGGLFCADILFHIETLERRLGLPATADLEVSNAEQTALPSSISPPAVFAQADPGFDQSSHNTASARQDLLPDACSSQQKLVHAKAGSSVRHDSIGSISTAEADRASSFRKNETAIASHKDQRMLTTDAKATASGTASMQIKEVKQNTVKIGAIFGEHIQMSHFLARPPNDSVASSVPSTADDIGCVSASVSQLALQQRESSRSTAADNPTMETADIYHASAQPPKSLEVNRTMLSQNKPTALGSLKDATSHQSYTSVEESQLMNSLSPPVFNKPSASDEPTVTPKITMRKDPKLADDVFTRQYSSHATISPQVLASSQSRVANKPPPAFGESAGTSPRTAQQSELEDNPISRRPAIHYHDSVEPRYASTNPFAHQQGSVELSSAQSSFSARNDTSPFSRRFNTTPYRRDESSARADRIKDSSADKPMPKIPDFLRGPRPQTRDPGAAARRQYEDLVNPRSPSGILSERVPQQMNSSQASSKGSGFQNARASITTSNPPVRPSQVFASSENVRQLDKKASRDTARHGPK